MNAEKTLSNKYGKFKLLNEREKGTVLVYDHKRGHAFYVPSVEAARIQHELNTEVWGAVSASVKGSGTWHAILIGKLHETSIVLDNKGSQCMAVTECWRIGPGVLGSLSASAEVSISSNENKIQEGDRSTVHGLFLEGDLIVGGGGQLNFTSDTVFAKGLYGLGIGTAGGYQRCEVVVTSCGN